MLGWEDSLEKEMTSRSSILAWENPWTGQPGRLQSLVLQVLDVTEAAEHHIRLVSHSHDLI